MLDSKIFFAIEITLESFASGFLIFLRMKQYLKNSEVKASLDLMNSNLLI